MDGWIHMYIYCHHRRLLLVGRLVALQAQVPSPAAAAIAAMMMMMMIVLVVEECLKP